MRDPLVVLHAIAMVVVLSFIAVLAAVGIMCLGAMILFGAPP